MKVDSSGLVDELPENMIKWFANFKSESCENEPEIVTEYKIIEVYVDSPSDDYETQNIDGTVVKGGEESKKDGKSG
jgi:hypothetical protein